MAEPTAPVINDLNRPFWTAAAEGRLVLPWCPATERSFWPPSPLSPFADGAAAQWREASRKGVLLTCAIYRRAFQKAFEARLPYAVGLVELDVGPRLLAHLGDPAAAPRAGERVALSFEPILATGALALWARRELGA